MKRPYRKSLRPQKIRGVPVGDERWAKLFEFMKENEFTMQDFLCCVCANFVRYPQSYYETMIRVGNSDFSIVIQKYMSFGISNENKEKIQ